MKFKKLYLCFFVALLLFALMSCRSDPVIYNVNTMHTATAFGFTDHGEARVSVSYLGYQDTVGANIHVKIEKQGFLFFRRTIVDQSFRVEGEEYQTELFYPMAEEGQYFCTVTYTVSGKGEDDVIVFTDEKTYRKETRPIDTTVSTTTEATSTETTTTGSTTTETTTTPVIPEIPAISASEFAEKLSLALAEKEASNTEFSIQKIVTVGETPYQTQILTSIQSDFRDDVLYSYFSTADSQTEAFENYYIFIDDTIYVSVNGDRYQKPLSQDIFVSRVPHDALSLLFGARLKDAFSAAKITAGADGSMTASLEIPFAIYYDPMLALIDFLTNDDFTKQSIYNYWNFVNVEVTLDENGALRYYSFAFSYDVIKDDGSVPTQYVIKATEKDVDLDNFRKYLLPQDHLDRYPTEKPQDPEQSEIPVTPPQEPLSAEKEEFLTLFRQAYTKWNPARYQIKVTSSSRWTFDGLFSVDIPLTQSILMDCSDPDNPIYHQQAISSDTSGYSQTDIYFKNDRLYVSDYNSLSQTPLKSERKYSVTMLSDYFLADAQFDWLFFEEDMLTDAEITKNNDGSITASMKVSGYGSELRALAKATYGDDFSDEYINDVLLSHNVKMTIDANGYITQMTVSAQIQITDVRNGSRYAVHYGFIIEPNYTEFNIDFPNDLDTYEDFTEEYYRE